MAGTYVQGKNGFNTGTSFTIVFDNPVASGSHVMGSFAGFSIVAPTSVEDNQSNTYTVTSDLGFGNGGWTVFGFYAENITNAPTTITFTFAASASYAGVAHEVSGLASSSSLDGTPIANRQDAIGTGTDAITCGAITTTVDGDYIFATHWDQFDAGGTISAGTGFTERLDDVTFGGFGVSASTEDQTQTSAGSITATFTHTASADVISMAMAFKADSGAPPASDFGGPSTPLYRVRLRQY